MVKYLMLSKKTWRCKSWLARATIVLFGLFSLAGACGTAALAAEQACQKPEFARIYELGVQRYRSGDYDDAYKLLKRSTVLKSDWADSHLYLGRCCLRMNSCESAIKELNLARQLNPIYLSDTAIDIGQAYLNTGRFDDALKWCEYCKTQISSPIPPLDYIEKAAKHLPSLGDTHRSNYLTDTEYLCWSSSKMPLRIRIVPGNTSARRRLIFTDDVKRSLNAWCAASRGKVSYKIVVTGPEDILFTLSKDPPVPEGENLRAGITKITRADYDTFSSSLSDNPGDSTSQNASPVSPSHELEDPHSALVSPHSVQFVPKLEHSTVIVQTPKDQEALFDVILHETGHALGIHTHSNNYLDLMRESRMYDEPLCALSRRDVATIQRIYSTNVTKISRGKTSAFEGKKN